MRVAREALILSSFIMTVAPDGNDARPVIALPDPTYYIGNPKWSPDGTQIAFTVGSAPHGGDLYIMNADGTGARQLFEHSGWDDIDPSWSPDGTVIRFQGVSADGASGVYEVPAEGGPVRLLVRFDDPTKVPGPLFQSAGPGDVLYLTLREYESDIYVADLEIK